MLTPAIHITKLLSTVDGSVVDRSAEAGTIGIVLPAGTAIFWTYRVTNVSPNPDQTVDAGLVIISLIDDNGTPADPSDDFWPVYVSGDTNGNGQLDVGEV